MSYNRAWVGREATLTLTPRGKLTSTAELNASRNPSVFNSTSPGGHVTVLRSPSTAPNGIRSTGVCPYRRRVMLVTMTNLPVMHVLKQKVAGGGPTQEELRLRDSPDFTDDFGIQG